MSIECLECGKEIDFELSDKKDPIGGGPMYKTGKHEWGGVPNLCDDCMERGWVDLSTPQGYAEGMKLLSKDPNIEIGIKSPYQDP